MLENVKTNLLLSRDTPILNFFFFFRFEACVFETRLENDSFTCISLYTRNVQYTRIGRRELFSLAVVCPPIAVATNNPFVHFGARHRRCNDRSQRRNGMASTVSFVHFYHSTLCAYRFKYTREPDISIPTSQFYPNYYNLRPRLSADKGIA